MDRTNKVVNKLRRTRKQARMRVKGEPRPRVREQARAWAWKKPITMERDMEKRTMVRVWKEEAKVGMGAAVDMEVVPMQVVHMQAVHMQAVKTEAADMEVEGMEVVGIVAAVNMEMVDMQVVPMQGAGMVAPDMEAVDMEVRTMGMRTMKEAMKIHTEKKLAATDRLMEGHMRRQIMVIQRKNRRTTASIHIKIMESKAINKEEEGTGREGTAEVGKAIREEAEGTAEKSTAEEDITGKGSLAGEPSHMGAPLLHTGDMGKNNMVLGIGAKKQTQGMVYQALALVLSKFDGMGPPLAHYP